MSGEQNRERIHATVTEVALRLFEERGFDTTTIGDIAASAGVAPITVFRHFQNKEGIVFSSRASELAKLRDIAAALPAHSDPRVTVRDVVLQLVHESTVSAPGYVRLLALIKGSPRLQRRALETRALFEVELAAALQRGDVDPGRDLRVRMAASGGVSALYVALLHRVAVGSGPEPQQEVAAALEALWPDLGPLQ